MTSPTASPHEIEAALLQHRDQTAQRAAEAAAELAKLEQRRHTLLVSGALTAADEITADVHRLRAVVSQAHVDVAADEAALRDVNRERQLVDARKAEALHVKQRDEAAAESRKATEEAHELIRAAHAAVVRAARHHDIAGNHAFQADEKKWHARALEVGDEQALSERPRFVWSRGDRLVESIPSWAALVDLHKRSAL